MTYRVGIAYSTKDRVELSRQSSPVLLDGQHALFWVDGSTTEQGRKFAAAQHGATKHLSVHVNITGGADAAIVYSLTMLLKHPAEYTHVGLVENDVLLDPDWFKPTMDLFAKGHQEGLTVGAVSARSYEDRVLIQRRGYAVMHNTGAGMIILTRKAAKLILKNFRTTWAPDNRILFNQLSGIDIGRYWAFGGNAQYLTADWGFDAILASHGLASLALTPAKCEMIGQVPSLAEQGLRLVDRQTLTLITTIPEFDEPAFALYRKRTEAIRTGKWVFDYPTRAWHLGPGGVWTIFPHHIAALGGEYSGDWRLRWAQGYGPFAYRAGEAGASMTAPVSGDASFMVGGGERGGQVCVEDLDSGYKVTPTIAPESPTTQMMLLPVPHTSAYRQVRVTALTAGIVFYGLRTGTAQPQQKGASFDYETLPPV